MNEIELKATTIPRNRREKKVTYNILPQEEKDEETKEERDRRIKQEETKKTNIFRSRIIQTEINSSLLLQIIVYYQYYFSFMSFFIQFSSVAYKIFVFSPYQYNYIKIALLISWLIIEYYRTTWGLKANIEEDVSLR